MKKIKTTKKSMKNEYDKIIKVSYCAAQYLLNFTQPVAYSARAEGWACDYYEINGVLISTGYSPIDNKNTKCNYELIQNYEDKAKNIICDYNLKYEEQKNQVETLLNEFINVCIK